MRSEEEVIYSFELWVGGGGHLLRGGGHLLGGGGHLLGGGGHLYLKILVSAPVPFWVFWGWNWDGLCWDWVWGDWGLGLDNNEF